MAFPSIPVAVGDVLESVTVTTHTEQAGLNVRHWRIDNIVGGTTDIQKIADAMATAWAAPYKALMSASALFRGVRLRRLSPGPPTVTLVSSLNAGPGDIAGDPLPRQVSGIITLQTTQGGPSGRGRMYIPFPSESANDPDSTPSAIYVIGLEALAGYFVGTVSFFPVGGVSVTCQAVLNGGGVTPVAAVDC